MTNAFLIARQEFIKYVTRRGFLLSVLMFPLWIMIVIFVPRWTGGDGRDDRENFLVVVDQTGGAYLNAVQEAAARDTEARNREAFLHYAAAYVDPTKLAQGSDIAQMLAAPDTSHTRRAFHSLGVLYANDEVLPFLKSGAPNFVPPGARFVVVTPPPKLTKAGAAALARYVDNVLAPDAQGGVRIAAVAVIPKGYGPQAPDGAQVWSRKDNEALRDFVSGALTDALRQAMVLRYAPALRDADLLNSPAPVESLTPPGTPVENGMASVIPVALAIILFVISVMNSSVLLQGVVEEKSTRMIEVLLSCATPRAITAGKLIGVIAVALTTLLIWALVLMALMAMVGPDTAALVLAALKAVASASMLPLLLLFFLCGLLIYGSIFLAIGSMAASLADAQALLGPSMLILMLPNLMIGGVMHDPNGPLATWLTWVPVYTPFFMMLRIPAHPPVWQLWAATALALATTAGMIVWTGRIFAKHVLTTERPPTLGALIRGLLGRAKSA